MNLIKLYLVSCVFFIINCNHKLMEEITIKKGQSHQVTLPSRGALGLQLNYRCNPDSIVEIHRKDVDTSQGTKEPPKNVGDSIPAIYEIKGINVGATIITFYETQPWNKDFKEILIK